MGDDDDDDGDENVFFICNAALPMLLFALFTIILLNVESFIFIMFKFGLLVIILF